MFAGVRKPYPIKIKDTELKEEYEIKDNDELIRLVENKLAERLKITKSVKLSDILWSLLIGIDEEINPIQLVDERTAQIFDLYWFYIYQPHLINNKAWFESVKRLNRIYVQRSNRVI